MPSVFMIATTKDLNDAVIGEKLGKLFPGEHYVIGRGQWLVAFSGTARELYDKLSPGDSQPPQSSPLAVPSQSPAAAPLTGTIVIGVGGYFGRASREMWEWMATKLAGVKIG